MCKVLNARQVGKLSTADRVYVGRPSKWGNPRFVIGRDGSRDQVIAKYRVWIVQQTALMARCRNCGPGASFAGAHQIVATRMCSSNWRTAEIRWPMTGQNHSRASGPCRRRFVAVHIRAAN